MGDIFFSFCSNRPAFQHCSWFRTLGVSASGIVSPFFRGTAAQLLWSGYALCVFWALSAQTCSPWRSSQFHTLCQRGDPHRIILPLSCCIRARSCFHCRSRTLPLRSQAANESVACREWRCVLTSWAMNTSLSPPPGPELASDVLWNKYQDFCSGLARQAAIE